MLLFQYNIQSTVNLQHLLAVHAPNRRGTASRVDLRALGGIGIEDLVQVPHRTLVGVSGIRPLDAGRVRDHGAQLVPHRLGK